MHSAYRRRDPARQAVDRNKQQAPGNDSNLLIVFYVQIMPD
ncbi:NADH:flavorubredoxin oxidoreductase, partial [Shigella dysenteriae]